MVKTVAGIVRAEVKTASWENRQNVFYVVLFRVLYRPIGTRQVAEEGFASLHGVHSLEPMSVNQQQSVD